MPKRRDIVACGQQHVLECAGSDVGFGELGDREPVEFTVDFLAYRFGVGGRNDHPARDPLRTWALTTAARGHLSPQVPGPAG
ncbi:MAG: hypothetical protein ACRDSR_08930 [Pseudonocardiaceae bacterium]